MVSPPGYTGFITNLPFWVTRMLQRMLVALLVRTPADKKGTIGNIQNIFKDNDEILDF